MTQTNTSIISSSASLADVIAAVNACQKMSAETKLAFIAKACDPNEFERMRVALNYYLADSEEFYDGDGSDCTYDKVAIEAEKAKKEAEEKAYAEKKAAEKKDRCMNLAANNLHIRGVKMFVNGEINPAYQKQLNEEIDKLMKGKQIFTDMDTGESFTPDMEKSGLSKKQLAIMEKADIDSHKSNKIISNEDRRPMADGEHFVKINFYQERKGKDGKSDYAIINVVEESTGKHVWLNQWSLADPASVDRSDMWKCRLYQLKTIAENSAAKIEGLTEDEAVEYLREHEFSIFTYQKDDGAVAVYTDRERYKKFVAKQTEAQLKAEESSKREEQLDAVGLAGTEEDISVEEIPWKI